ncbi:MAG: Co2+/Mg2+ efflux protein ApaG [Saprospiraceae bacterium]|nr:Co2+/Mg2+ efflux protein ApaG [Saprospiraceae bacterium]
MTDKNRIYNAITEQISISVIPRYEAEESNPAIGKFIFSYQVTIENIGLITVKLLSRHWHITDSIQIRREVKGEGVIGKQPVLKSGDVFNYMSWCPLNSPIGKMSGIYIFQRVEDKSTFEVVVPEFVLISDFKLN